MANHDWSQCPAVESVPGKVSGAWVLRGTRMPVAAIFENIEAGASIDDIMEWFDGLNREQVKAVIEFAARSGTGRIRHIADHRQEHASSAEPCGPQNRDSRSRPAAMAAPSPSHSSRN